MNTTISITQQHIDDGRQLDCSTCPTALALYDAYDHVKVKTYDETTNTRLIIVHVWGDSVTFERNGERGRFIARELLWTVRRFIRAFDRGDTVRPLSFDMDLPFIGGEG